MWSLPVSTWPVGPEELHEDDAGASVHRDRCSHRRNIPAHTSQHQGPDRDGHDSSHRPYLPFLPTMPDGDNCCRSPSVRYEHVWYRVREQLYSSSIQMSLQASGWEQYESDHRATQNESPKSPLPERHAP